MSPAPFSNWDDVVTFALSLPDTALASFYGQSAPKVNGKAFVSQGREPGSFHVPTPHKASKAQRKAFGERP
jgi:hypothetical protein